MPATSWNRNQTPIATHAGISVVPLPHQHAHASAWEEEQVASEHARDGPRRPEARHEHVAVGRGRRDDVGERREDPADEIEGEVPQVPERVLDVVSEDPEIEHVSGDVGDAAVHEHGDQEGQVDGQRSGLQPRLHEGLAAHGILDRVGGSHHVLPADDLLWDRREGVGEPVVGPHSLQKHEHHDVRDDQEVVDERGERAAGIVVAERNHSHLEPPVRGSLSGSGPAPRAAVRTMVRASSVLACPPGRA